MVLSVPDEIEAKLTVPREADLRAMARLREIGTYELRPIDAARLHSIYLDTAELALARRGVALRARRQGRRWELTAKWRGTTEGEVHRRPELTVPLRGHPGDAYCLEDPELLHHLAAVIAGRVLQPILITDIFRRRFAVVPQGAPDEQPALAELALDRVHLHNRPQDPDDRYFEVEIEQREGTVDDLRNVSVALQSQFDLLPSDESKFSRGMALMHHPDQRPQGSARLTVDDTVTTAARKVCRKQLERIRRHDPGARSGEDPEELHAMRVATRRLRAALPLLEAGFPKQLHARLGDSLRWLGRVLGTVRDLDVQIERVEAYAGNQSKAMRVRLEALVTAMRDERDQRRAAMRWALVSERYYGLLVDLERYAEGRVRGPIGEAGRQPVAAIGAAAVEKARRRLLEKRRRIGAEPKPEELHGLRIRAKRLRYTIELFADIAGKSARRAVRRVVAIQDHLGMYNDSTVALGFVMDHAERQRGLAPSLGLALGALVAKELDIGQQMRGSLERCWKRAMNKKATKEIASVVESLSKSGARGSEPVAERDTTAE